MRTLLSLSLLIVLLTACQPKSDSVNNKPAKLSDNWQLLAKQSSLSFVTTKNKVITEEHTLAFESGEINQLNFNAHLDLASINTQIDIRDQRLRDILFETSTYPTAAINSLLPKGIKMGQTVELPFTLNLHGQQKTYTSQVLIQWVDQQLVVTNYDPININAKDFGLDGAVNQLTQIAGLQGINYDVLVDFKLAFKLK